MAKQKDKIELKKVKEQLIRKKLLQQIIAKKRVNIMANIEDKIKTTVVKIPQNKPRWL